MIGTASEEHTWFRLRWPRVVDAEALQAALSALQGLSRPGRAGPLVLRTEGSEDGLHHSLGLPAGTVRPALAQLRQAIPGLLLDEHQHHHAGGLTVAAQLVTSTTVRSIATDHPERSLASLLRALVPQRREERLLLQLVLGPTRRPLVTPNDPPTPFDLRTLLIGSVPPQPADARAAFAAKHGQPGWRAVLYVGASAGSVSRASALITAVASALRSLQAPGVTLRLRRASPARAMAATPWRFNLALNLTEALVLSGWPCGDLARLPLDQQISRVLPPARGLPSRGRILGLSAGSERRLAISIEDGFRHLHLLGPTGVGKSTLLLHLIDQDLRAGRGVVVVDAKGDLVDDVLARVPADRRDVVVLDPSDPDRPVGFNPLASDQAPELIADQLLSVFRKLYAGSWGPRLQETLHVGILSMAGAEGVNLCQLPRLYLDPVYRRGLLGRCSDDPGLAPFWAWFESLSEGERSAVLAPVLNKVRPLLLRPSLRGLLGQSRPRFDLARALSERAVVVVSLATGRLGPEAAQLFGGLVVSQLWQAIQGRQALPPARRSPLHCYLDEFDSYVALPTDLGDVLARARSYRASLTLAHQHLHQLPPELRSAVLENARSRVVFQLGTEDAAVIARGHPELDPEDLTGLPAFEAYAQLVADGAVMPFASLRTLPPPEPTSDPKAVREASRQRYGVERSLVEAELRSVGSPGGSDLPLVNEAPIGQRRRTRRTEGPV